MRILRNIIISLILVSCCVCAYIIYSNESKIVFVGENQTWECKFVVHKIKNMKSGLYETDLSIKYKGDNMSASYLKARLTDGNLAISDIEIDKSESENKISDMIYSRDGMSHCPMYSSPLSLYISIDRGEEEYIELYEKK